MIAKVRIAPVERWCDAVKDGVSRYAPRAIESVGLEVQIDTATMHQSEHCGGKAWKGKSPKGWTAFDLNNGESVGRDLKLCEHVLELD